MFIAKAEKTDLLHLGVRDWEARQVDVIPAPEKEGCVLVWHNKLDKLPDIIIVEDDGTQNFLAWTTAYTPHLTPITALVEVVEHQSFSNRHADGRVDGSNGRAKWDAALTRGYLGLIHAEVAAGFHASHPPSAVGITPYVSTFSWLALQRETVNSPHFSLRTLRENWEEARRILNAVRIGYKAEHVEEVWAMLTDSNAAQNRHVRQVAAFLDSVRCGKPSADALDIAQEHSSVLDALQVSPLEYRVELFRKLLESLYERRDPPAGHAVLLGFALSLISQGSFSHVGLVGPSRVSDVRPLLWYGWFDFFRNIPDAASPPTAAASLQLLRAMREPCSLWRYGDIAIDELCVLSRQNDPFGECLLDVRHPIRVEIANGAVCLIQPGSLRGRARHQQRSLFDGSHE